ncbi:MAG: TolC family protein [Candidatus Aminicenantes bacterium]|jgi:outer membrane protein TolC
MLTRKVLVTALSLLIALSTALAQKPEQEFLTLEECIFFAIKNNLDVTAELMNPEIARAAVRQAGEKFLPTLSFSYRRENTNSSSYSWIEASEQISTKYSNTYGQISQLFPTGGRFYVSLNANMYDTSQKFLSINPRYGSTLNFTFSQPLLRDFGFKTNRREILVAQNNRDISENDFKKVLLDTIYAVEEAYWNLVFSIQALEVKRQSLVLAQDLLQKSQKEVEIGTLAPKEILSAQAEVAAREADILQAESSVKNNIDRLKTIMNLPDEKDMEIVPADKPGFEKRDIQLDEAYRLARENRPDLLSSRIRLNNRDLDVSYAWNQLLPSLNLNANYWSPGLSGDQILYLNNNPFTGVIVGKIPGGSTDALKDAMNFKYQNWSVYFSLDIPLNSFLSRAAYTQAKLSREQAQVRRQSLEKKAFLETKTTLRTVQTDYKRVEAYRIARELAEKKLEAEEAKLRAGLTTHFVVLQYQRDLANARSAELKAVIDYNMSLSRLDNTLGISLKTWNIQLSDVGSQNPPT